MQYVFVVLIVHPVKLIVVIDKFTSWFLSRRYEREKCQVCIQAFRGIKQLPVDFFKLPKITT